MILECMMVWCMSVAPGELTAAGSELPAVAPPVSAPAGPSVWDRLAECESHGQWDYDPSTADWGSRIYEGGVQFLPKTWDDFRPDGFPDAAFEASREQQIVVAERVLQVQGWGAWPSCSRELGLRP